MPKLSFCMIVKNEEAHLQACLQSVQELVDEMIIVDTGSTDKTVDIAKQFTDKIVHFDWGDDFSAARNFSLSKAVGDWILYLDADEVLAKKDHGKIRSLIADTTNAPFAYALRQREYTNDTSLTGFRYITQRNSYCKNFLGYTEVYPAIRLFQKKEGLQFQWKIHESIASSLEERKIQPIDSDIVIHHYKAEKGNSFQREKMQRYLKIGEEQVKQTPNHPKPYYELGLIYYALQEYKKAAEAFEKVIALSPAEWRAYYKLGRCFVQLQQYSQAAALYQKIPASGGNESDILAEQGILSLKMQQYQNALSFFQKAIEANPANILARHNLSILYLQSGKKREAQKLLLESDQKYPNPYTSNTLGILAMRENQYESAVKHFEKGLALNPREPLRTHILKNLEMIKK